MGAKALLRPAAQLYDEDFALWSVEMARLLRERRFDEVDVEHVTEEIEDMAKRDRRELWNRMAVLIKHLLMWQYQRRKRAGSWGSTIIEQRAELESLFAEQILDESYPPAGYPARSR